MSETTDTSTEDTNTVSDTQIETGTNVSTEDIESAKQSAITDLLKEAGLGSVDELKNVVKAQNDATKANQTDLENSKSELKKSNEEKATLSAKLTSLEATNAVLKAGVVSDHVEDATILAQAKVANGTAKDFDKAIKDVLKSNPQFTGDVKTGPDGTAINTNNISNNRSNVTKEQFNKMDYGERLKVYTDNPELYKEFTK